VTPYDQLTILAGFTDAWTLRPGRLPGFTCCQQEDLANRHSLLFERIDMIFALEPPGDVKHARVVGATTSDKTWPPGRGLWSSDHGAVTAELVYD
jgi:hypothetical protein